MKKYIGQKAIIISLLFIIFSGCSEDMLDLPPKATLTVDQFYVTADDFETAIAGVYYQWQELTIRPRMMCEYRSDNIRYFRLLYGEMSSNTLGPSSTEVVWGAIYKTVIHPANMILLNIDDADIDASVKDRIKGEALFMRGWSYYWLNNFFEGVVLVTKPLTIEESYQLGRASEADTWAQVESDLSAAVSLLPDTESEFGRFDKYDAETFLAKTYMQQQKWGPAETALADVYQNCGASLEPDWTNLWTVDGNANSPEIMLASIWGTVNPDDDMGQFTPRPGNEAYVWFESSLIPSFESGDIRKDISADFTDGLYVVHKYQFGFKSGGPWEGNVVVLRFTDVQLLYAEAITMNAGSIQQQSLDLINETRNRAGLNDILMADLVTMDDFTDALLAERRAEFVLECQRFTDLKRYGILVEKLNEVGYNYDDNYNRLPIPVSEILKMNGVLEQNPGY